MRRAGHQALLFLNRLAKNHGLERVSQGRTLGDDAEGAASVTRVWRAAGAAVQATIRRLAADDGRRKFRMDDKRNRMHLGSSAEEVGSRETTTPRQAPHDGDARYALNGRAGIRCDAVFAARSDHLARRRNSRPGFVAIVGRPNAGKSTLVNRLVGHKVSIVTSRPQTTRNRILGIVNRPDAQVVLIDTPGMHRPRIRAGPADDGRSRASRRWN